jgi:FAD/FMN-containing dehydrogenase
MRDAEGIAASFRALVGADAVVTDPAAMAPYLTDWRGMFTGRAACVLRPRNTAEVSAILRHCDGAGIAVVPQGGNTGLAGGATPDAGGLQVVLSLSRMAAIRDIDPTGLSVEVEAGAILQTVREAVAGAGRLLPVSIAAEGSATIGGIVSTNAGGVNVLRYGMTRDLVLGLEVVLADGTVVNGLRRLRKDNAGQDWKQLFIGTEGSLGIVTAAVLRLVPRPTRRMVALISVPELPAALTLFDHALSTIGEALSAFELISAPSLDLVARHFSLTPPVAGGEWYLLIEAASTLPGLHAAAEALMEHAFTEGWASDGVIAASEAQADGLWALREHVTEAEAREGRSIKHDVSVPLRAMPRFLSRFAAELARIAPEARPNIFGHLGDGNLHVNVLLPPDCAAEPVMRAVHDLVAGEGGSISAEHGLGQYRLGEWERLRPAPERALVTRVKRALDPRGVLNPGKAVPVPDGKDAQK